MEQCPGSGSGDRHRPGVTLLLRGPQWEGTSSWWDPGRVSPPCSLYPMEQCPGSGSGDWHRSGVTSPLRGPQWEGTSSWWDPGFGRRLGQGWVPSQSREDVFRDPIGRSQQRPPEAAGPCTDLQEHSHPGVRAALGVLGEALQGRPLCYSHVSSEQSWELDSSVQCQFSFINRLLG